MEVLFGDDAEAIANYLKTPEGLANINTEVFNKGTPLYNAALYNRNDVLDVLIEFGADVDKKSITMTKETPLHMACRKGHDTIVTRLLSANPDVNVKNCSGSTPLMYTAIYGWLHIAKLLTPYADFNISTYDRYDVFSNAIARGNEEMVNYVFDYCNDINRIGRWGRTYLHIAVDRKKMFAVKFLLEKGIDTNICDDDGKTARETTNDPEILALIPN